MTDLSGCKVLVLEDLFYLAMDVKSVLTRAAAEVLGPFSTSSAALASVKEQAPDCALLDVNLGEGATYEVARALRMRDIPFVFFTGYDASAIPPEFTDVPRLQKPVTNTHLIEAVRNACRSAAQPSR